MQISRRRWRETSVAVATGTVLDHVATNAAILGIDGRDAFLAPRFVELLQNGRVVGRAVMIHAERYVFDDLQATRTQLTFASSARAVACDAFLFGKELGCQIGCKVAAMFRFSNASFNGVTRYERLDLVAEIELIDRSGWYVPHGRSTGAARWPIQHVTEHGLGLETTRRVL